MRVKSSPGINDINHATCDVISLPSQLGGKTWVSGLQGCLPTSSRRLAVDRFYRSYTVDRRPALSTWNPMIAYNDRPVIADPAILEPAFPYRVPAPIQLSAEAESDDETGTVAVVGRAGSPPAIWHYSSSPSNPPSDRSSQRSTRSKVSGACTPMVGCSADGGCHAR